MSFHLKEISEVEEVAKVCSGGMNPTVVDRCVRSELHPNPPYLSEPSTQESGEVAACQCV